MARWHCKRKESWEMIVCLVFEEGKLFGGLAFLWPKVTE